MDQIVVDSKILGGKPIIQGTRISVSFILELLASRMSIQEILEDYPQLSQDDIYACLQYAAQAYKNEVYLELKAAS
ncbi:MAG: DUF433 domain-containing protein [SAR324 cluster bacterium]|nr:DUF433 domain-containing protein [SAR324 cluster bacterium]